MNSAIDPQTILKNFEKLRLEQKRLEAQIATKEDLAARQKDKELVKQAANYTADTIFRALAKLQATFGGSTAKLTADMTAEVEKLAQIQQAIQVENVRHESLRNVQIAAEALNILQQEHQKNLQTLEDDYQKKQDVLEIEIAKQRELWQQAQQDYNAQLAKQKILRERTRRLEEENYQYNTIQRKQTQDADAYSKQKRALERQLADTQQLKDKDWAVREKYLADHQTELADYKAKVEAMPKELEEAVKKAREEAIKDTFKDEENKAKLLEKEVVARRKAFELRIESLKQVIEQQKTQLTDLSKQLQAASSQVQQLATKAVAHTGQTKSTERTVK